MASKLILLAAVVAVVPGGIQVDQGILDGLRPGDVGVVHYRLDVGAEGRRVDVGHARVTGVEDRSAVLELPAGESRPGPGFQVEFELPASRLAPAGMLIAMARHRFAHERVDEAAEFLDSWQRLWTIFDPATGDTLAEDAADAGSTELLRGVAERLLGRGDLERAERYLELARKLRPEEPATLRLIERLRRRRSDSMARIAAAEYRVGVDLENARYFNQQPRFTVELAGFSLDRRPVTRAEFAAFRAEAELPGGGGDLATGLSFAEAGEFCSWRDKRLPSEFEWEVAVRQGVVDASAPIYEWTDSWYQPYLGNTIAEKEYGETVRVLRGHVEPNESDPAVRRFLVPRARHASVGFRCARDASSVR